MSKSAEMLIDQKFKGLQKLYHDLTATYHEYLGSYRVPEHYAKFKQCYCNNVCIHFNTVSSKITE